MPLPPHASEGLVSRKLDRPELALEYFIKVNMILPDSPEVVAQIAEIYEEQGDLLQALEWYQTLVSISPTDPDALARTAELYDKENDKSLAYQHMLEVSHVSHVCEG